MGGLGGSNSRHQPRYCTACGASLEPGANYCSACGRAVSPSGSAARSAAGTGERRQADSTDSSSAVTDRDVLEYRIARATEAGWKLEGDYGDYAVMVRRTVGDLGTHALIAILTIWFTGGLANLAYAGYKYVGDAERVVLRADQPTRARSRGGTTRKSDPGRNALGWFVGIACFAMAGLFALMGVLGGILSVVLAIFVFLLGTFGVIALPPIQQRVRRRHSVTTNGRARTVDERAVSAPEEPCTTCSSPVDPGVERTYRESFCVLGFPLTTDEGRNHYCRGCANAEGVSDGTLESGHDVSGPNTRNGSVDDGAAGSPADTETGRDTDPATDVGADTASAEPGDTDLESESA
ncbi:zinc-ribbon domain-containing protein [Natrarchaeobaculum aegyptiacum]|uniref:Uncharacterized protein n=1 Tax=Natrarchaeobaculum aegyptiacum TaxID=745377 RepID=A0A2Z2HVB8_9EURY|nr:zinc-ribbon domain-containing protein [Natrarchaeobaculum aegyptiacum]ARS91151.1 hypothetical protein B1756_16405 [Natrarchaeobaculum aegyptiacum]